MGEMANCILFVLSPPHKEEERKEEEDIYPWGRGRIFDEKSEDTLSVKKSAKSD